MALSKKRLSFVLCLLFLLLTVISCKKSSKSSSPPPHIPKNPELSDLASREKFNNFVNNHRVSCLNGDDLDNCPEGVARILIYVPQKLGGCTGFLVDKDIIATNYHCLVSYFGRKDQNLKHDFAVFFPQTKSKKMERFAISSIIEHTKYFIHNPTLGTSDYAFLKLERGVDREIIPMSFDSPKNGDKTAIWSYNFYNVLEDPNHLYSILEKEECQLERESLLGLHGKTADDLLIFLSPCNVKPGNSGSPILNSNGKALGIIYGGKKKAMEYLDEMKHGKLLRRLMGKSSPKNKKISTRNIYEGLSRLDSFGLATNFRCLCPGNPALYFLNENPNCQNLPDSCLTFYNENSYFNLFLNYLGEKANDLTNHSELTQFNLDMEQDIGINLRPFFSYLDTKTGADLKSYLVPNKIVDSDLFNSQNFKKVSSNGKDFNVLTVKNYPICYDEFMLRPSAVIDRVEKKECSFRTDYLFRDPANEAKLGIGGVWYQLERDSSLIPQ